MKFQNLDELYTYLRDKLIQKKKKNLDSFGAYEELLKMTLIIIVNYNPYQLLLFVEVKFMKTNFINHRELKKNWNKLIKFLMQKNFQLKVLSKLK